MKTRSKISFMKYLLLFLSVLTLNAQTHVYFDLSQFNVIPPENRLVDIQPLTPVIGNFFTRTSHITAGTFYYSNANVGDYYIKVRAKGLAQQVDFQITVMSTNLGVTNAIGITSVKGVQTYPITARAAWTTDAADRRYLRNSSSGSGLTTTNWTFPSFDTNTMFLTNFSVSALNGPYVWDAENNRYAKGSYGAYYIAGFYTITNAAGDNQIFAYAPDPENYVWGPYFPIVWEDGGAGGTMGTGNWLPTTRQDTYVVLTNVHIQGTLVASNMNIGVNNVMTNMSPLAGAEGNMFGAFVSGYQNTVNADQAATAGGNKNWNGQRQGFIGGGNENVLVPKEGGSSADSGFVGSEIGFMNADASFIGGALFTTNTSHRNTAIIGSWKSTLSGGANAYQSGGGTGFGSAVAGTYESWAQLQDGSFIAGTKHSTNVANGHRYISMGSGNILSNFSDSILIGHNLRDNNGGIRTIAFGYALATLSPDTGYFGFYVNPLTIDTNGNVNIVGTATANSFSGSAAGLTEIPASQVTGNQALSDNVFSQNVPLKNQPNYDGAAGSWSGENEFGGESYMAELYLGVNRSLVPDNTSMALFLQAMTTSERDDATTHDWAFFYNTTLGALQFDAGDGGDDIFKTVLFSDGDGSGLTALNASSLGSGTIPDARFPATLPAVSGANLTSVYKPGGTDVAITDGGTGSSTAYGANDALSIHGADVASSGTLNLDSATGDLLDVTGTTTITAITLSDGRERTVRFTGALTLTHGASLVLPGSVNRTTVAGDMAVFRGYSGGVVRCVHYSAITRTGTGSDVGSVNPTFTGATISGGNLLFSADNTYDIGASSATRPRIIYAATGLTTIGTVTAQYHQFQSFAYMQAQSDGVLTMYNNAGSAFTRLQFGGTSSSFPAEKRNGATLETRLADDSGFAARQSLYDRFGSGSPESSVTAPVGAVYHRTDGGAGTSFYVKESGSGNTGWIAK